MPNTSTASGSRPASRTAARTAATRGAMTCLDGPDMNTHSAWRPAKARPAGEVPAWYSTGVRWGEGSLRWMASSR